MILNTFKIFVFTSLLISSSLICQTNSINIIGKWKNTESSMSNGNSKFLVTKIKNGETLDFKSNNIVVKNSKKTKAVLKLLKIQTKIII